MADAELQSEELRSATRQRPKQVPFEIYASLVDALYETPLALVIGSAAATGAALIAASRVDSIVLLLFAAAIALFAIGRLFEMRFYRRSRSTLRSHEAVRRWERRYIIGSTGYVALLGAWCVSAFSITDDPLVRLLSYSMVLAYMVGIYGRNFASKELVLSQMAAGGIALIVSPAIAGGWYLGIAVTVIVPLLISIKMISDRLRAQLLDALISARDITQLAARFTTALNNMPHGLVMFDSEQRLLVANDRFVELLGLPHKLELAGKPVGELFAQGGSLFKGRSTEKLVSAMERRLLSSQGELTVEIRSNRWLSFTTRPMENGGSVMIVEDVTERHSAQQRIDRMARFDMLTGLPNRNHLHEQLERLVPKADDEHLMAILFVDLDEFKQVNDTLGHPAGDQLLCIVANRLRKVAADKQLIARFGGDEFVVIQSIDAAQSHEMVKELAERIMTSLSQPYQVDGHDVIIGASVGIAFAPRDGADPDLLLKNADMALYHAKASGKGVIRFFDSSMDADAHARRVMELDVRQALAERQFELYYQPLLDLKSMKVRTCEALLRWKHPARGMVPPSEFIPVAEDIGIIREIGQWVVEEACRECASWPAGIRVAVNLSPVQFRDPNLPEMVLAATKAAGLDPARLEVEITESVLLKDTPTVREMLERLVAGGVRLSLDDFGTGYSGLSYLQTFPLNKVKIDRSFVAELHSGDKSLTLLRGMARLSAALGLDVVVEGIETPEQLDIVASEGTVSEAQGYVFSIPLPSAQLRDLLASGTPALAGATAGDRTGKRAAVA